MICRICEAPKTVLYCKKQFEERKDKKRQDKASYYYCSKCKSIFLGNLPKADDIMDFVNNEYNSGSYKQYVGAKDMKYDQFNFRIKKINSLLPFSTHTLKNKKLLDVGCSCGYFIDVALENGYDAYGIELSEVAISYAKPETQKRIVQGDINTLKQSETINLIGDTRFNIVTAFDIIEHTVDPIVFLEQIKTVLKPDGTLILVTPDISHFLRYIMRGYWPMIQPTQHFILFSRKSIKIALEKAGYKDISIIPAYKIVSFDYLLYQIELLNPNLFKIGQKLKYIIPTKLRKKLFNINIGEFMVIAHSN